jgi:hypothetical protein
MAKRRKKRRTRKLKAKKSIFCFIDYGICHKQIALVLFLLATLLGMDYAFAGEAKTGDFQKEMKSFELEISHIRTSFQKNPKDIKALRAKLLKLNEKYVEAGLRVETTKDGATKRSFTFSKAAKAAHYKSETAAGIKYRESVRPKKDTRQAKNYY